MPSTTQMLDLDQGTSRHAELEVSQGSWAEEGRRTGFHKSSCTEETIGPDPHSDGSELPPSVYAADIGYLVDGTPLDAAGNNAIH